jgi:formyl-CoA transferase
VLGEVRTVSSPFEAAPPRRGPLLGEDTDEVLARVCGYDEARIAALSQAGAFGTATAKEGA